jgi:hypothetical protein
VAAQLAAGGARIATLYPRVRFGAAHQLREGAELRAPASRPRDVSSREAKSITSNSLCARARHAGGQMSEAFLLLTQSSMVHHWADDARADRAARKYGYGKLAKFRFRLLDLEAEYSGSDVAWTRLLAKLVTWGLAALLVGGLLVMGWLGGSARSAHLGQHLDPTPGYVSPPGGAPTGRSSQSAAAACYGSLANTTIGDRSLTP